MSQPPPPLLKHPVAPSPSPNIAQGPNGAATSSGAQFIPRREFIRDHRIASSFSLLALSGSGFVRLYSFSTTAVSALRRLFDHRGLVSSVREHGPKHFFEFSLEGKPWSNAKSITSEKLIIDILAIVLHCGYIFLSTIDYGREPDDKLALVFSKPQVVAPGPFPFSNGSTISLHPPVVKTPFAISFSSATLLRVVGPPLHSTPAVLQAVRGAWPRGVVSEKKVGDATYEFKLKGYKWFQEDTFATDSLHHIIGLLGALDAHGFTLLTSLSLTGRSRVKDLWIFTGDHHPESQPSSPTVSNTELRRETTPQQYNAPAVPSPLSLGTEKRTTPPRNAPGLGTGEVGLGHRRYSSDPVTPTQLKPAKGLTTLHKPSPKVPIPVAFVPEYASSSIPHPTGLAPSPPPSGKMVRSLSKPSSIGSVDMTGVGSGLSRSLDSQRTPDVFYAVDGRQHEYNSFFLPPHSVQGPPVSFLKEGGRRMSADSKDSRHSVRPPRLSRSSTLPSPTAQEPSSSSIAPKIQVHAPSPMKASSSGHAVINGEPSSGSRRDENDPANRRPANVNPTPTPTPPLLTPGTFEVRDSAYSSATRWTREYPWVGREHDQVFSPEQSHARRDDPDRHHLLHIGAGKNDMEHRSTGQAQQPSAGQRTREPRRDDVAQATLPPSIREHHGSQTNAHTQPTPSMNKTPFGHSLGRNEAARAGIANGQGRPYTKSPFEGTASPENAIHAPKPQAVRRDTAMSGWVMVNVEAQQERRKSPGHTPSPARPGVRQRRSNSDSRILRSGTASPVGQAPATATMSAAAKTIAMIDAVDARDREKEKTPAGGLTRMFHRTKGSESEKSSLAKRRTSEGGVSKVRSLEHEERDERQGVRDKLKMRGHAPHVVKSTERRIVLD
ncbi:hypothetical protein PsYK624_021200 [Phanerochaete sordida]|uniref:Uncharacterized protein n=1 Tax=Phanerochaete sordida TaxID=48140 RepID=A0A9P3G1M4_9APHY|nr:hypothetical protein PsYK624_021200 [Phanerochaete sordida]